MNNFHACKLFAIFEWINKFSHFSDNLVEEMRMLVILKSPNGQQNIHVLMEIMMLEKIIQIHNMRNNYITYIL